MLTLIKYAQRNAEPHNKNDAMCLNETYSKVRIGKHLSDCFLI
jgi:hypothetical protein